MTVLIYSYDAMCFLAKEFAGAQQSEKSAMERFDTVNRAQHYPANSLRDRFWLLVEHRYLLLSDSTISVLRVPYIMHEPALSFLVQRLSEKSDLRVELFLHTSTPGSHFPLKCLLACFCFILFILVHL